MSAVNITSIFQTIWLSKAPSLKNVLPNLKCKVVYVKIIISINGVLDER